MGHSKKIYADSGGLTGHDVAQLAKDGLAPPATSSAPIHGIVMRHGQPMRFSLDASNPACEPQIVVPEQIAIAALVLTSFIGAIWHLFG